MDFFRSWNPTKCRYALQTSITRINNKTKQKKEQNKKFVKEIENFLKDKKYDNAKVTVELVIQHENLCLAMAMLENFSKTLLTNFDYFKVEKRCPMNLITAVASIVWAANKIKTEIPEFMVVKRELVGKFGQQTLESMMPLSGSCNMVHQRVYCSLSAAVPKDTHIMEVITDIAKTADISIQIDEIINNDLMDTDVKNPFSTLSTYESIQPDIPSPERKLHSFKESIKNKLRIGKSKRILGFV